MNRIALTSFTILCLLSTLFLIRLSFNIQPVKASGTIYIRDDGSIDPQTVNITSIDNVTYTFTDNNYDRIVVERDDIVIDGSGYTLQGTQSGTGLDFTGRSNITIRKMEIDAFYYGIWLYASSNINVTGNNITNNHNGIYFAYSSNNKFYHNNIIDNTQQVYIETSGYPNIWDDGYPSGGNYWSDYSDADFEGGPNQDQPESDGIGDTPYIIDVGNQDNYPLMQLYHGPVRNLNTGQNYPALQRAINNATDGDKILALSGVYYENVVINKAVSLIGENSSTTIVDGNMTGDVVRITQDRVNVTGFTIQRSGRTLFNSGISISSTGHCDISGNRIVDNEVGVYGSPKNTSISNNTITNNHVGVAIDPGATCNIISRNRLMANNVSIHIYNANSNNISENNIVNNWRSITLGYSRNNRFYHNYFFNNTEQVLILASGYANFWDNGLEGNYWDNYTSVDSNYDGIGDSYYIMDANNTDHFPLMGEFHKYHIWYIESGFTLTLISNSTISNFVVGFWIEHPEYRQICFNVAGETGYGFCRLCIPKNLMAPPYTVTIDNGQTPVTYYNETLFDNSTHRWIYFAYLHSEHQVIIIAEFPSFLILPLFMIATLLAVIVYRRLYSKRRELGKISLDSCAQDFSGYFLCVFL